MVVVGGVQMHCLNTFFKWRYYVPDRTCQQPLGSACLWVCLGAGDAHCVAVAVVGGGPDAVRLLFSIGR